jgi:hypothetical protein
MAQVVVHLPSKFEALISNLNIVEKSQQAQRKAERTNKR